MCACVCHVDHKLDITLEVGLRRFEYFSDSSLKVVPVDGLKFFVSPAFSILEEFTNLDSGPCVDEALKIIICDDCDLDGEGGFCGCLDGGYWGRGPFGW